MSESRSKQTQPVRKKRSFIAGCFSQLIVTILIIGALLVGGYFWMNQYLQQYVGTIPTREMTQIDTTGLSSIDVTLNPDSFNQIFGQMMAEMPENPYGFEIAWEEDQLVGQAIIEYNGMNLPVELKADIRVAEGDYFQIVIESINVAEIPLPRETAYDIIASQLILPEWLVFHADEPILDVDFSQMPLELEGVELTAAEANLAEQELTITVHYDAANTNLTGLLTP